jgi:predicted metal-dependent hydrolase
LFEAPEPAAGKRRAVLDGQPVDYTLKRSKRRTIGFVIDDRGLTVTAPRWVRLGDIDTALADKSAWIARKLHEWRGYAARRERLVMSLREDQDVPFLGRRIRLVKARGNQQDSVVLDQEQLLVSLPPDATAQQFEMRVQGWLQTQARSIFEQRIEHYANQLGIRPSRWGLSSARTRWGSCGPDGAIRLNWRLVHFPQQIIDYVVAHELAHLCELNHSPRFWDTVGQLFPDFDRARQWLRQFPDDMMAHGL